MREERASFLPSQSFEVQNFAREEDRKRLTGVTLKAFRKLAAEQWHLSNPEAASLLGVSVTTWERIKRGAWDGSLTQDQFMRVSALVGIFKGLHLLFADDMATRWLRLKNTGPLFHRATPLEAMIDGGIPLMMEVRRYIDAVRGGL